MRNMTELSAHTIGYLFGYFVLGPLVFGAAIAGIIAIFTKGRNFVRNWIWASVILLAINVVSRLAQTSA